MSAEGYSENFLVREGDLYTSAGTKIPVEDVAIDSTFRIESDSDPTHQSVIYALSCAKIGLKGTIVNSFGTYSEPEKDRLMQKLGAEV